MEAIDRLYILVSDGDPLARRHIGRFSSTCADPDSKARAHGPLAAYFIGKGHLRDALTAIRTGLAGVTSQVGLVELVLGRSSIALNCGEPSYAIALTDRTLLETYDDPSEARALALFGSAIAQAYSGRFDIAQKRWQSSLGLTRRPLYEAGARINLAMLAIEQGNLRQAKEHLEAPSGAAPRMLRAQRRLGLGRIAAGGEDYPLAAHHQATALELMSHRGVADRATVAVDLVDYLHRAGDMAKACEAAQAIGAIVLEMDDERHELAAAALTELVYAGTTASLSRRLIESCAASLASFNRGDRRSRPRDQRALQPREPSNSSHRQSSPT